MTEVQGMVKAVFIDYMGTTVDEHSPEMAEIVHRICKNSSIHCGGSEGCRDQAGAAFAGTCAAA